MIQSLSVERNLLRNALQTASADGVIPAFVPRPTISRLVTWLGWAAIAIWGVSMAWGSLMSSLTLPVQPGRNRVEALLVSGGEGGGRWRFTLASGRKSDFYIDCRTTTMSAEGQVLLGGAPSASWARRLSRLA